MRKGLPPLLIAALAVPLAAAAPPGGAASAAEITFRLDHEHPGALDNLIATRLKPLALAQPVVEIAPVRSGPAETYSESAFARILQNYSDGAIKADAATRAAAKRVISSGKE